MIANNKIVYFQLKVQEAMRKKERFQREHEEVGFPGI